MYQMSIGKMIENVKYQMYRRSKRSQMSNVKWQMSKRSNISNITCHNPLNQWNLSTYINKIEMFSAMSKPTKIKHVKCYLSSYVNNYIKSSQQLNIKSQALKKCHFSNVNNVKHMKWQMSNRSKMLEMSNVTYQLFKMSLLSIFPLKPQKPLHVTPFPCPP
jgi:hypothetical protein